MPPPTHLLHLFSTFAAGGPQVRTATILNALPEEFRHTIVALDGNLACAERLKDHPRVRYADPPRKRGVGYALRLGALVKETRPDLLLTYNWGAIEAIPGARLRGFRRILHAEDGFGPEEATRQLRRRVWFRRMALPLAKSVVVPSRVLLGHLEKTWRVPAAKRVWIPNGIDVAHFAPGRADDLRARWGIAPDEKAIGTVARLRAEKGLDLLLHAFADIAARPVGRRARLVLVGDGPEEAGLRGLARELGVEPRVVFAGPLAETRDAYRAFDLFALSSRTEQMPISVVEAMACGLALASSDVGDVRRMLAPENAPFVVAGREPAALADALATLLADDVLRREIGAANRARAEQEFPVGRMVSAYLEVYRRVLAS
jgi:glycosyltransferase involved in cell wall biosynthesis